MGAQPWTPICPFFLYEKSFFGPAGFSTAKNSQKGPQTHLGLLPLLQQCSGNGISTATTVDPHMPIFLQKNICSTRLAFCMLRTAKKAPKGTQACLCSSSSALATVIQLSTPHRGQFWRCLVSLCSGAVRCTQPTDPPQVVFYAQGYCPGLSDHRRSDSPYSAALTQH